MSAWIRDHLDHHLPLLMDGDRGPLKGCTAAKGHSSRPPPASSDRRGIMYYMTTSGIKNEDDPKPPSDNLIIYAVTYIAEAWQDQDGFERSAMLDVLKSEVLGRRIEPGQYPNLPEKLDAWSLAKQIEKSLME